MFVLVYNLKSKSFCLQSILNVLCLKCLNQNIYFVLLKFENNIACINNIYFQVLVYTVPYMCFALSWLNHIIFLYYVSITYAFSY